MDLHDFADAVDHIRDEAPDAFEVDSYVRGEEKRITLQYEPDN